MNLFAILLLAASVNIPDDTGIRHLVSTGGPQAERTLLDALPHAQGSNTVALIKALGDLRSDAVVAECARHLDTATGDLRDICLYALSRTTSSRAARLLRARLADNAVAIAYLRHGESLAALGRIREPATIALDLLHVKTPSVRCAAITLFTDVRGYAAQPTLLAMLDDADLSVREQASRQLTRMPTAAGLLAAFRIAKNERRALLFDAIARRADPANAALMISSLRDEDESIRRAAAAALRNIHGKQADAEIAKALALPVSQAAALELLAQRRARAQAAAVMPLINNPAVAKQAFTALGLLAGEPEVEQLIAAALASKDDSFREQAARAISTAAPRLADNARCVAALAAVPSWGLALLPAFGGQKAIDAVVAATKGNDQETAVRALADWRDLSAMEPLLALCREANSEKLRALAVRGAIRIVRQAEIDKEEKVAWLYKISETAPRAEEKQQTEATPATAHAEEEGFVSLFNGKDLTGWTGDTKGYVAEDNMIVCRPGGNLYTEKEYSDFIMRFEFKLTPGANNGLGIRAPGKGDAAYVGMELQILDDTSPKYAELQPYQYHGSIYGIVPAIRGHLKPVGEWNVEEVTAIGPHIKVVLNGVTIVDANLDEIKQTDKMHDLKKHPGLHNKSGRIGFLGHGSVIEFRNIRVKKVAASQSKK